VKNKIFGIDLRKALIKEGLTKPFGLTVGLNYTHVDGSFDLTQPYQANGGTTVQGSSSYATTFDGSGVGHSDWKLNSFGVQAILNKKILFLNPYIGASANRNSGTLNTSITTAGNVTLTDVNNSANTGTQSESVV